MIWIVVFLAGVVVGHLFAPVWSALAQILGKVLWHGSIYVVALIVFGCHLVSLSAVVRYVWVMKIFGRIV